ncbi:MAG TPA: hypothetical protein VHZ95_16815 [Polyangiales bacterium]|jgi:hypothetical protein|nr:hypothetical protein [Polyangiales bacterium]
MPNRLRLVITLASIVCLSAAVSCGDVQCPSGTHHDGAYCRRDVTAGTAADLGGTGGASSSPVAASGGVLGPTSGTGASPH